MGEQETVTINGARMDRYGGLWIQLQSGGLWHMYAGSVNSTDLEAGHGPTRPVRVVTTEPPEQRTSPAEDCGHDDDRREALAWASRQFRLAGIEDMHAVADAVLELADRYLAWLRGTDGCA